MSTHLRRILEVAAAVAAAAYSSALVSPAATDFLNRHPEDAAYVALAAGLARAVYKALVDRYRAAGDTPPPSQGSETMGAS